MQVQIPDMDLRQIAASGQCFRMEEREPGVFSVIAGRRYLEIGLGEQADRFEYFCEPEEFETFWRRYFDLETDYGSIKAQISEEDEYLKQAALSGWGIRILRQELWEMIITFIISQQNNIPRIKRCVRLLCERYGEIMHNFRGETYFAFPEPEALASAELDELLACNLGYRARYVKETAQMVMEGLVSLDSLCQMKHEEAKKELLKLCGVGVKVAECVCLFALHHVDAFPVDTHIAQVLELHYPGGFPFRQYRGAAGIMQQYIFFYEVNQTPQNRHKGREAKQGGKGVE